MSRVVTLPPIEPASAGGVKAGGWWHDSDEPGRIVCDLCPRACSLKAGDRGFCFVRENRDDRMVLTTYGRSTGFCIDPIEKKPLNHFYPGTSVLSFGTAGCNLGCKFCQNWSISKSREVEKLSEQATPEAIAEAARELGCRSVAFTYNDPVIWAEYAIDVARACRAVGIKTVAVTAGYITPLARGPFYEVMDAANVDLKGFTEDFYQHLTLSHLAPVLETLEWLKRETPVWFEITNLVIPQANDSLDEIGAMCDWILDHLGDDVPTHFTAFHPDFRLQDRPRTPRETLLAAYDVARRRGLKYVYVGNVDDQQHQSTYCPQCGQVMIERNWYEVGAYELRAGRCRNCGCRATGHFDDRPGNWGRKRMPVDMSRFAESLPIVTLPEGGNRMESREQQPTAPPQVAAAGLGLTAEQERLIHRAASEHVTAAVEKRLPRWDYAQLGDCGSHQLLGAFVSLKRRGRLRSCCGFLGRSTPLGEALQYAAVQSATRDDRLPSISPMELAYLDLEVWLLHGATRITAQGEARRDEIVIGRDGLSITHGDVRGLLLPGVAVEHHLDAEGFLRQVCLKAGLPPTAWKEPDAQLMKFLGHSIGGRFDSQALEGQPASGPLLTADQLVELAEFCRRNVLALCTGATPSYYWTGGPDGMVNGLMLTLSVPPNNEPVQFNQLALRPGMPLQATLLALAQAAAAALQSSPIRPQQLDGMQLSLAILSDPAMHGTLDDPDLDGFDSRQRALLVIERDKMVWRYAPEQTPQAIVAALADAAGATTPSEVQLFSLVAESTQIPTGFTSVPQPQAGSAARPAAVAGTFYPADPAALSSLLDDLLSGDAPSPEPVRAVMVPHAGLIYSGRIAAAVLRRTRIPRTVIAIGPKHTRLGVEWAVAPHETWSLPGASVPSDPALARQLVDAIPGLKLDAMAHRQEHAIEVELPFLARLAPHARVVGIAIGAGNLERCRQFAAGLADVLKKRGDEVLLLVSSDMNHFANDAETRRLDELALAALEQGDPGNFYQTIQRHQISMCGALPALIVMETLQRLHGGFRAELVAYGTSADTTGDTRRVVGYAGMLFE